MNDLLIANGNVLSVSPDGKHADILWRHDVLVRGQRIEAVQPARMADPSHFRTVIDATGKVVMPGFVNCHAHVPMVLFRGLAEDVSIDRWFNEFIWPLESNLVAEDVYWGMLLGAAEMIRAGITTVADHYFHMDRGGEAIDRIGMRGVLGWAMFGSLGQPALDQTDTFIREWQGAANGRITTMVAPHAPYTCDDAFLAASGRIAKRHGVRVHIHASEVREQTEASLAKRGITPIEVLEQTGLLAAGTIIAHACGVTPDDVERMASANVGVATAPKTYLKLGMDVTPVRDLRAVGIPVGLATDGVVSNNTLDLWEAMRLTAMLQKDRALDPEVLTIPEALAIATHESANVVGLGGRVGAVAAGYLADLIVVDTSGLHHQPLHSVTTSLVYSAMASDVVHTVIDGQVVMRDRQLLTIDVDDVIANVSRQMQRLAQRVPGQRIQTYTP
ncbi:MAG: amidohydrolase [Chloroflexi bacterium]|nr:amidohydrolase [Chloroflexota bacterium]